MSKRFFGCVAALLCIALPAFAGGGGEKTGGTVSTTQLLPWTGAPVTYSGFGSDLGIKEDPNAPVVKAYRALTGDVTIKWETAPWNDYDTKMNLYVASGDLPDIVWSRDSVVKSNTYGPQGLFLDFDAYKQYMPNLQAWAKQYPFINNVLTASGGRYAINDITTADYFGEGWFYNQPLLARAGVTAPPDDFTQMLDMMKKVKAMDPTMDGFFSYYGTAYVIQSFANSFDAKRGISWDFDQKKWIHGESMDPNYRKVISYLSQMYAAHLFNPELISFGNSGPDREFELFEKGNYAFSFHYYGEQKSRWLDKGRPEVFVGMRPPKIDNGRRIYYVTAPHDGVPYWGYMASAKVKQPELLAAYVDNIMSQKVYELFEWGLDGVTFKKTGAIYETLPDFSGTAGAAKLTAQGVGSFNDPRYIHFNDYKSLWFGKYFTAKGENGRASVAADIKALKAGQLTPRWTWARPLMSAEANDDISKIMTPVNTYIDEQSLKFITGQRPMSEWDDFIAETIKLGEIQKVLDYYNSGKQFPMGARLYPDLPPDLQ